MNNMKKTVQILMILLLSFGCRTASKLTIDNPIMVDRIAIKDPLPVNVSGTIFGFENRVEPFARIELINETNSYFENSQDDGEFEFDNVSPGEYLIKCSSTAHYVFKDSIVLKPGEMIKLKVRLRWLDE